MRIIVPALNTPYLQCLRNGNERTDYNRFHSACQFFRLVTFPDSDMLQGSGNGCINTRSMPGAGTKAEGIGEEI
jgi:hypothetical protein